MLTPMDIRDKSFNVRMRGFDQDQVNDFLDQIIADYEALLQQQETTSAALKDAEAKVEHYESLKNAMNQSIIVAQEAADRVKADAEEQAQGVQDEAEKSAESLLTDATQKSNVILSDASDKARQLTIHTEDMRRNAQQFRDHLALLLRAELETVEGEQWADAIVDPIAEAEPVPTEPIGAESVTETPGAVDEADLDPEFSETFDNLGSNSLNSSADDVAVSEAPESVDEPADGGYTEIVFPDDPII